MAASPPFLALLLPTRGLLFTKGVLALQRELAPYDSAWFCTTDLPLPESRNRLAEQALDAGLPFTHLLMVDDDVVLPEGALEELLSLDADLAVLDYPTHYLGKHAATGTAVWSAGELLFAGLGCVLARREVFDRLGRPYFRAGGRYMDTLPDGSKALYGRIGRTEGGGEDFEFFQDCRAAGCTVAVSRRLVAGHAKVMRHVGVVSPGKYVSCHDIHVADRIDRPLK